MRSGNSRASLFLIEIIAAVLVFSVCSAVCLNIFAAARVKSSDASKKNFASIAATSAAEALKGCGFDCPAAAETIGGSAQGGTLTVRYDGSWDAVPSGGDYILTADITQDGTLTRAHITVSDDAPIFSLDIAGFTGGAL